MQKKIKLICHEFFNCESLSQLALASSIFFALIPSLLIFGNADEILHPKIYFLFSLVCGLVILIMTYLVFKKWFPTYKDKISSLILSYAISIYISDIVFPIKIGPIEAGHIIPDFDFSASCFQLSLFLIGILLLRQDFRGVHLKAFCNCLWAMAVIVVISSSSVISFGTLDPETFIVPKNSGSAYDRPNVYHIVFDSYYGPGFMDSLRILSLSTQKFQDFIYFPHAFANSDSTEASFASFLSGTLYDSRSSIRSWYQEVKESSIFTDLQKQGYVTSIYAPNSRQSFGATAFHRYSGSSDLGTLADYWTLRVGPVFLRPFILGQVPGVGQLFLSMLGLPNGDLRSYRSYEQLNEFFSDEQNRSSANQYVLIHIFLPHGPYRLDRYGNLVTRSSYEEQMHLSTQIMIRFIDEFKRLNKFDNSLIIFSSDHGTASMKSLSKMTEKMNLDIKRTNVRRLGGKEVEARQSALLMIKYPNYCIRNTGRYDLDINKGLVSLIDLRKFIRSVTTREMCEFLISKRVDIHFGLVTQVNFENDAVDIGRDIFSGQINHYRVEDNLDWKIMPNISFTY